MTSYHLTTSKTWAQTEAQIKASLTKWGAETYALSRGVDKEGKPVRSNRAWQETPAEATVTLVIRWKSGRELRLQHNAQTRAIDNARVLYLACEALRMNEKRGLDSVLREAYAQLPAPAKAQPRRSPWTVLEIAEGASLDVAEASYRVLARRRHPDAKDGSEAQMVELNAAIEELRQAAKS